jgi:enamine deaminase RidA (YjgF/YER057c/UK114 family)
MPGDPPSPYELRYGFSRVVTAGPFVLVGGTTSVDEYGVVHGSGVYEQTVIVLDRIVAELGRAGLRADDVVQTRFYVVDISRADDFGRAHEERFGAVRPLMTAVQVSALIDPRMLVEVECVAWRG